ncbi:hypothetical protein GCM10018780_25340 [Streptomyces lanatus]|nr:hypothetical protein GCM10018780_25340 [Streptomyces lanatus]
MRSGNCGAQIAADLAYDTQLTWVAQHPPRYLADAIDSPALFDAAAARCRTLETGRTYTGGVAPRSRRPGRCACRRSAAAVRRWKPTQHFNSHRAQLTLGPGVTAPPSKRTSTRFPEFRISCTVKTC